MKLQIPRSCVWLLALTSGPALGIWAQDPPQVVSGDPQDWPMYNRDSFGTRWNRGETILGVATVPKLHEIWRYATPGDVYATPAVVGNIVYFGDSSGLFHALTSKGRPVWSTQVTGAITASALVSNTTVVFGDQAGYIYGLERSTGAIKWKVRPNPSSIAEIWSSAAWVDGDIVIGIGSSSNLAAQAPGFSGSVVRISPSNGRVLWQTFMVSPLEFLLGSSGAAVWDTPTYDPATGLVYVATSNAYSSPASASSDAVLALNAATGVIEWRYQATAGDIGQLDQDFGDSPHVYSLGTRRVIGIGQKSGRFFVLDAYTGTPVSPPLQAVAYCQGTNGLFATAAVAGDRFFSPSQNCLYPFGPILPPATGQLTTIKSDGSAVVWSNLTIWDNAMSGVAVANGVVYYSVVGLTGNVIALDAVTGATLANVFIGWGASGPSISHGQVCIGTGTLWASGYYTPPSLVALGV